MMTAREPATEGKIPLQAGIEEAQHAHGCAAPDVGIPCHRTLGGFTDGKTENVEWKTGEVRINAPSGQYTTKNIGKTDVELVWSTKSRRTRHAAA
jgi:hypothetical protein